MRGQSLIRIHSLHHGAVPVSNLGRAYRFFAQVFSAQLDRILNATPYALQRGLPEIALLKFAGKVGFGLALQYDAIPVNSEQSEGTIWGLETDQAGLESLARNLAKWHIPSVEHQNVTSKYALERMLSFQDPDGNRFDLSVPHQNISSAGRSDDCLLRYASVEVRDLSQAEDFYCGVLGLKSEIKDNHRILFAIGQSGEWIVVRKVERTSPRVRLVKGPHIALEVDLETFATVYPALSMRERYWQRDTNQLPWQEPWKRIGYLYDPFQNRLALVVP